MKVVRIPRGLLRGIEAEAVSAYPDEACGFLYSASAEASSGERTISSVDPAANEFSGERRRRFVISAAELRAAEARGSGRGEVVSGFYHSHPDHPAVPSAFDTEHAWPWYTYLVVAVEHERVRATGAFELDRDAAKFEPCALKVESGPDPHPAAASLPSPGR